MIAHSCKSLEITYQRTQRTIQKLPIISYRVPLDLAEETYVVRCVHIYSDSGIFQTREPDSVDY